MGTKGKWCFEVGEAICLNTAEKMSFGLGDGKIFSDLSESQGQTSVTDRGRDEKKGTCAESFEIFGLNRRRRIVWMKGQVGQRRKA